MDGARKQQRFTEWMLEPVVWETRWAFVRSFTWHCLGLWTAFAVYSRWPGLMPYLFLAACFVSGFSQVLILHRLRQNRVSSQDATKTRVSSHHP